VSRASRTGHAADRRDVRIEVVAGGRPDAMTVAAIGLAVRAVLRTEGPGVTPVATSGWRRAALREGVGGTPEVRPVGRG
jgi:hypothetical protein